MERATGAEVYGCGSPQTTDITLNIQTTTGGNFSISLNNKNTVENLKKMVSKKLKVSKDRICLLHRDTQLRDGTLEDNGLLDGSRIILLPSVETGLLSQRPENSVMQALESLNDSQVNDFLSGKSPLNLTMRLGDHMMLIQLQLSTLNSSGSSRSLRTSIPAKSSSVKTKSDSKDSTSHNADTSIDKTESESRKHVLQKQDLEILQNALHNYYRSMAEDKYAEKSEGDKDEEDSMDTTSSNATASSHVETSSSAENEQSPIKSLSNLVSNPIDASISEESLVNTVKNNLIDFLSQNKISSDLLPSTSTMSDKPCPPAMSHTSDSTLSDDSDNFADQSSFLAENTIDEYPMESLFNSAVDKGLFDNQDESVVDREISNLATTSHGSQDVDAAILPSFQSLNEPLKNKRFQYLFHKSSKFKHPLVQSKQKAFMQSVVNKHKKRMQKRQENNVAHTSTTQAEPYITNSRKLILQPSSSSSDDNAIPSTSKQNQFRAPNAPKKPQRVSPPPIDAKALIEASKNLTQKLKKLSKEVLTNKIDLRTAAEESVRTKFGPGAVIESMKHHGKGVYSGTFSGTLNPALQDRYGRPKRDISTIIHILNDLLCATPPPIALAQKESKQSHAASTSNEANKCLGCNVSSCPYVHCNGHLAAAALLRNCVCPISECKCIQLDPNACPVCATKNTGGELCKKCEEAKIIALDNTKTKCKLEQLRLVMQQKKQRREARKLKTLPYGNSPPKTHSSPEHSPEEIKTVA